LQTVHQCLDSIVPDPIVNEITFPTAGDDTLVAQNGQVLGKVAVGRLYRCLQIGNRKLAIPEATKNLESDRMSHGF
jgi:hypothetical protein